MITALLDILLVFLPLFFLMKGTHLYEYTDAYIPHQKDDRNYALVYLISLSYVHLFPEHLCTLAHQQDI